MEMLLKQARIGSIKLNNAQLGLMESSSIKLKMVLIILVHQK